MQTLQSFESPLTFIRKILMVVGAIIFLILGYAMFTVAGKPEAARNTSNVQPELNATVPFTE